MERRKFLKASTFTLAALTLPDYKSFSSFLPDPWKVKMLTKNIGIFTERGGTIAFMLGKRESVVVDSQFPEQAQHLIAEIKKKSEKPFRLLINTHHHGDHTAGNIAFKGIVDHVLAHENSKTNQIAAAQKAKTEDKQLYPDQTYGDTWCDKFSKEKICLKYFGAGHTNGDSLVHFQRSDIVHMGDLVFNRRYPFIDRPGGANIKSWINVLDKADEYFSKRTQFIFGHAAEGYEVTGNKEDIKAFKNYLEKLLNFAEMEVKAGKTKEEFLKNTSVPGVTEWKGEGIVRSLTAAYEEITESK